MFPARLFMSTTPAAISAYYRLNGNAVGPFPYQWALIDGPLQLTFDGTSPHIGLQVGIGLVFGPSLSIDTSVVSYRVEPPTGPGTAIDPVSGFPIGAGAWAADASFFYFTVPDTTLAGRFIWARTPLQTTW